MWLKKRLPAVHRGTISLSPLNESLGCPDGVEIPAPVKTTARSALRINTAASSIAARFAK